MKKQIIIEIAKNNQYTCKYLEKDKYKYLYSKYAPEKINFDISINEEADYIILLGLGLGYELNLIREKTNKKIYVIENYNVFMEHYLNGTSLDSVVVLFEDQYKNHIFTKNPQIIVNENLIDINKAFFKEVITYFKKTNNNKKKQVLFIEHPTIAKDCIDAFNNLGYKVNTTELKNQKNVMEKILEDNYDFIFSINFYNFIAEICEEIGIKYISWTVDTPCYTLYSNKLNYTNSYVFIYDESIVLDLKSCGAINTYYLPVAAAVKRLNSVLLTAEEASHYSSDVSFLGSCCSHNEYMNYFLPLLSLEIKKIIDKIVEIQLSSNRFVIKELIDDDLLYLFTKGGQIRLSNNVYENLDEKGILAFYLGRYHSYIERKSIIEKLTSKFDTSLYGEIGWLKEDNKGLIKKSYRGEAEHYYEMPKIFKSSKINLNITRCFVESGLPMRVFDVLGSKGFLVTNDKEDIHRLFSLGKDLVVYRDLKDLEEIISYYLNHEDMRLEIAHRGFDTVQKYHTFDQRIEKIMDIVYEATSK